MKPKLFRDPIHDIISFELGDPVEEILFELVQTRAVQRLRRIRQLGFTHLVYHGAEHSRFSHSLGVFHVAKRMVETLSRQIDDDLRLEVLAAALLHDIGHGPFSHAAEKLTGISHEEYSSQIVQDPESEVHEVLSNVDPDLPARVARYFGPREAFPRDKRFLLDIVSSQLDADRLDYILRDGLATGVKIGVFDFERIQAMLRSYTVDAGEQEAVRLAVGYRAREAVEDYLIARFHMFKQVYLHKTVRAAENMLGAALARARQLLEDGVDFPHPDSPALTKFLAGDRLTTGEFLELDDTDVQYLLKGWRDAEDPILARLSTGILDRQLYKTVELDSSDPVDIARTIDMLKKEAEDMGLDPEYAVIADHARDTPYQPYEPEETTDDMHIPIISNSGEPAPIEDDSDVVHLLGRDTYKIMRLCIPAELRDRLQKKN